MTRPTVALVDLSAIRENVQAIRKRIGSRVKLIPAVKANAYGHGAVPVSRACLEAGADMLGVACVDEAIELREAGIKAPLLILGCCEYAAAEEIVRQEVTAACCDLKFAQALSEVATKLGKKAAVHVKIDTGMGRIGIQPEEAVEFVRRVSALPGISVEGLFTHFPSADEPDSSFTKSQIALFRTTIDTIKRECPSLVSQMCSHASNSAGVLAYPEADFDAVRPGIMIYGLYPSENVPRTVTVRECLTLKTRIVFLKWVRPGTPISYGRTYVAPDKRLIATIPIGYADGYSRRLSNCGDAVVRGVKVQVVGRVCMDQTMLDVTDVPGVSVGDEVILYGGGYEHLSVSSIAAKIGTISYEVLCNIGARVPRIYIDG
ncbi:MAG: alanine racemase [Armatimonadota bacterium]|nr:alanine racemase [Armatimonadota bacterium]